MSNVTIVPLVLEEVADKEVKKLYGESYYSKGGKIYFKPKNYPYDKRVGYWFLKDNDLFMVRTDVGSN